MTGAIALVGGGWLVVVIGLTFASAPGKSMAIIGPPTQALAAIVKANGHVLASNSYVTIARSDDADFVARLYAAGALLVLDGDQTVAAPDCRRNQPRRYCERREAIQSLDRRLWIASSLRSSQ